MSKSANRRRRYYHVDTIVSIDRIAANDPSLTKVDLGWRHLADVGCVKIAGALRDNTHVTELVLHGNDIGAVGASALANMLKCNTAIIKIKLSYSSIGDAVASALAKALASNSTLKELDLSQNGITEDGASALAKMLESNTTITDIELFNNRIGDVGVSAVAKALSLNTTLDHLDLNTNRIGEVGAMALEKALYDNTTLAYLDLYQTNCSQDLGRRIEHLVDINEDEAYSSEEKRRRKIMLRIGWMVDAAEYEAAVALALDEMGNFPEAEQRRELFQKLLGEDLSGSGGDSGEGSSSDDDESDNGSDEGSSDDEAEALPRDGKDVAASVETVPRGRALYRYAAECGAAPEVLVNVLRAHPALCSTCRDIEHKLYPFMLLATLPEAKVGHVMEVLLYCPSLVESGIPKHVGQGKRKRVDGA